MATDFDKEWVASRPQLAQDVTCEDMHVYLYELVDRELTAEDCRKLEAHIAECRECAEAVEAETALREVLKQCTCTSAPESLRVKITQSLTMRM